MGSSSSTDTLSFWADAESLIKKKYHYPKQLHWLFLQLFLSLQDFLSEGTDSIIEETPDKAHVENAEV